MAAKYPIPPPNQFVALSCTNVGVGPGGTTSMLARVSLVDHKGQVIFESFVAPTMTVTDYRTATTGLEAQHFAPNLTLPFDVVQQHVANILKGKVLIGHSLWHDLSVLGIPHPAVATRDMALYMPFRHALRSSNQVVGLQTLMWHLMRRRIQDNELNPLENARAALDLYRSARDEWEDDISKGQWPSHLPPSTFSRCYL